MGKLDVKLSVDVFSASRPQVSCEGHEAENTDVDEVMYPSNDNKCSLSEPKPLGVKQILLAWRQLPIRNPEGPKNKRPGSLPNGPGPFPYSTLSLYRYQLKAD